MENGILSRRSILVLERNWLLQGWDGENKFIDREETGKSVKYMSMALFLECIVTI